MTLENHEYGSRELRSGISGTDVRELQIKIVGFGVHGKPVPCDGIFDDATKCAVEKFCEIFKIAKKDFADAEIFIAIENWVSSEKGFQKTFQNSYPCTCSSVGKERKSRVDALWKKHVQGTLKMQSGIAIGEASCAGFGNGLNQAYQFTKETIEKGSSIEFVEKPGFNKILFWAALGVRKLLSIDSALPEKGALEIGINNGYRCQRKYFDVVLQIVDKGMYGVGDSEIVKSVDKKTGITKYKQRYTASIKNHTGNAADLNTPPFTADEAREILKQYSFEITFDQKVKNRLRLEPASGAPSWVHVDTTVYEYQPLVQSVNDAIAPHYTATNATIPVTPPPSVQQKAPDSTESKAPTGNAGSTAPGGSTPPPRADQLKAGTESAKQVRETWMQPAPQDEDATDQDSSGLETDHLTMDSGMFPVGVNLTWHGGIHVTGSPGQPAQVMADGVVVAARLPEKDPAKPAFGSRNFVLVKHTTPKGDIFWSLYMHLLPILLKSDDPAMIEAMPWLYDMELSSEIESNFRPNPSAASAFDPARTVASGEKFTVLGQRKDGEALWYHVESRKDKARGWIAKTKNVKITATIRGLDDLKAGKVVKFEHPVKAGTCLGFLSAPNHEQKPFVHWEVFSEKLASGGWGEIKDNDEKDVVCDAEGLKKLINSGTQEAMFLEPLTKDLILATYNDKKKRSTILANAFRFKSEWAVDWEDALQRYDKDIAKIQGPQFNVYRFWEDAESAGCDLPKGGMVYHYHPGAFKLVMFDKLVKEAPKPSTQTDQTPATDDSIETNWPRDTRSLEGQNKYNAWIVEAAKKYSMDPLLLKALIGQESNFSAKAHNKFGYAGLTQIGGGAITEAGLSKGTTKKVDGVYQYDMDHDERFDPKKSIFAGALIFSKKRKTIDRLVFAKYTNQPEPKEKEKFYVAAYNAGEGTIQKAYKKCSKDDPLWSDLIAKVDESSLWEAIPSSWGQASKYKEITHYVSEIITRRDQ